MPLPCAGKGSDGMEEEEERTPKTADGLPRHLEPMAIEALEAYIVELEKEILRVKSEIEVKNSL